VVEDDEAIRALSLLVLRNQGYRTIEAFDGISGLTSYLRHRTEVDLILTDVEMPGLTGPAMVERIVEVEPAVRVVFMTGMLNAAELPQHNGKGYDVLRKPFTFDKLAECVRNCLETGV
jgi:DNA-binding NtrC family response regulator